MLKYVYNQGTDLSRDAIYAFATDYLEGKLLPFSKSEATPSNRAPGYITPLNAEVFDQVTLDRAQDVVVLFYITNGCPLCESIWPLYLEAAKALHRTQNLLFTAIDLSANELPEVHNLFYYPTLRYYPRDSKYRPFNYDGDLSLEQILAFVKRVANVPIASEAPEAADKDEL